jgi:signal transduction histidine kinase
MGTTGRTPTVDSTMINPFRPWRHPLRLVRTLGYVLTAVPVGAFAFGTVIALLATSAGLLITFVLALPVVWLLFVWSRAMGHLERSRIDALMGVRIADPVPPLRKKGFVRRLGERATSGTRWKEIAFHLARLPVAVVAFALTTAAWYGSIALALLPAYVNELPGDSAKFFFFEITDGAGAGLTALVGVVGLVFIAPWITIGMGQMELALARALLGPSADEEHAAQVTQLETSRSAAVDSAESERRRIERDLHDGAQQRLVALAANLGAAREKLEHDQIEEGRTMVAVAHEEAKSALKEIRDLVRGIHPVILEDRGLDAALSAVVARSPIPVTLEVKIAERPPATVESAAYFVVSEALANIARHAMATRAFVNIERAGNRLVIEVRDDGVGGAGVLTEDEARARGTTGGSGLRGLRDRVAGLGGSMYVISPNGGPTTISVELPCGS